MLSYCTTQYNTKMQIYEILLENIVNSVVTAIHLKHKKRITSPDLIESRANSH